MKQASARRKGYRTLIAAVIGLTTFVVQPVMAQTEDRQYKIEAAFLYNFFNYITWPGYTSPQAMKSSVICLYGTDPIEPYLEYIQSKGTGERQILIHDLKEGDSTVGCEMVYIRNPTPTETQLLGARHILVVSEPTVTTDSNGMIELVRDNERIRIRINQPLLEKNNFQVSSRLLNIAEVIK